MPGTWLFLIMRKATRYARSTALPAIAAVLAFTSANAVAQEAPAQSQPTTTSEPAPTVSAQPAPTLDAPVSTDTTVASEVAAAKPKRTVKTTTTTRHAAPVAARPVAQRTTTARATHVAAPAVAAAPAAPARASTTSTTTEVHIKPIVDTTKPANPAPTQTAAKPVKGDDTMLELGGGALALLALGAGAFALSRRRRHEDEIVEETYEPEAAVAAEPEVTPRHGPVHEEQPMIVGPAASAFAWGNKEPAAEQATDDDGSDRNPGESWVERAYRGPSPANPSVSLRNRLKRAAFFDKREREVAAGKAEPVETDAGLPDAMVEEQERELA